LILIMINDFSYPPLIKARRIFVEVFASQVFQFLMSNMCQVSLGMYLESLLRTVEAYVKFHELHHAKLVRAI
jgi:hypothetical protein